MKGDQRKRQIMETALKLFSQKGYHAVSVADILREMGAARGTFYRYFTDKYDLFDQVLAVNFRYVKEILSIPMDCTIRAENLESHLKSLFLKLMSRPNSLEFLGMMEIEAARADIVFAEKVNVFFDDLAEAFSQYLARIQADGFVLNRNPKILGYLILGLLKEVFVQWARGNKFEDLEVLIHEVATFIVYGMRPPEQRKSLGIE